MACLTSSAVIGLWHSGDANPISFPRASDTKLDYMRGTLSGKRMAPQRCVGKYLLDFAACSLATRSQSSAPPVSAALGNNTGLFMSVTQGPCNLIHCQCAYICEYILCVCVFLKNELTLSSSTRKLSIICYECIAVVVSVVTF